MFDVSITWPEAFVIATAIVSISVIVGWIVMTVAMLKAMRD